MPEYLPKAYVAIEDERFYKHSGVDIKGLFRSVVNTFLGNKEEYVELGKKLAQKILRA